MGKDKKPGILGFQTKDALKAENIKLTADLKSRQVKYEAFSKLLETLNREYVESKANVPMVRYNQLKDMIKKITEKKWIQRARDAIYTSDEPEASEIHSGLPQNDNSDGKHENRAEEPTQPQAGRGIAGLLQRCKEFAGDVDGLENKSERDLSTLSKQEVTEDNERKRKQLSDLTAKFSRFLNHLEELQKGYEESKKLPFTRRYGKMKELVKVVITDTSL